MQSLELSSPQALATASRSTIYKLLADGFRPPSAEYGAPLSASELESGLTEALNNLPYSLGVELDSAGADSLEATYLALFEVGNGTGAPCFLYEGEYGGGRMGILDDVLRFYHYFGLRLNSDGGERPDHLSTELEFMHALTFQEAAASSPLAAESLRRGQRDFLRLHLQPAMTVIASKVGSISAPLYPSLADFAASFCQADLSYLSEGPGGASDA